MSNAFFFWINYTVLILYDKMFVYINYVRLIFVLKQIFIYSEYYQNIMKRALNANFFPVRD